MNSQLVEQDPAELDLRPNHTDFLDAFFAADSARYHLLTTPCGSGHFGLIVTLVRKVVETQNPKRVLLVVPSYLRDCYREFLTNTIPARPVESINLPRYRELVSNSAWFREPMISVVANHSEWLSKLDIVDWDLAVVQDNALGEGTPWSNVVSLLKAWKFTRCLFVRATAVDALPTFLGKEVVETVWKPEDLKGPEGTPSLVLEKRFWKKWLYVRDHNEKKVLSFLDSATALLQENERGKLIKDVLYLRAASGISALEQAATFLLRNLVQHYGYKVSDSLSAMAPPGEHGSELDQFLSAASQPEAAWAEGGGALEQINDLCSWFDEIPGDNKLESLLNNIEPLFAVGSAGPRYLCVYSSFKKTASYLHSALSDEEYRVHMITDSTPLSERQQIFSAMSTNDCILVTTSQALECLPPLPFSGVVHYDLPATKCEMMQRFSGCRTPCPNYVIVDKSGANEMETRLLRTHKI